MEAINAKIIIILRESPSLDLALCVGLSIWYNAFALPSTKNQNVHRFYLSIIIERMVFISIDSIISA